MVYERLEVLKSTDKSKIYLIYNHNLHQIQVEKRLSGKLEIYLRLKEISHKYLPKIYDVRFENGETIVIEEYIYGGSLSEIKPTEKQTAKWLLELCDVLYCLHKKKILHRDIKPSNILIGNDGHIRLIDFDAAREEKIDSDRDTVLLGTKGYAPPEQYGFSQTDIRTDIYAVGITFKELLGEMAKKYRWKHILKRCTALDPSKRYKNVLCIKIAFYFGKFKRQVFYPVIIMTTLLFTGFISWSYLTDIDVREAVNIVLKSERDMIFEGIEIETLKNSNIKLGEFNGNSTDIYKRIREISLDGSFISTGYTNENGYLLFGKFSKSYNFVTGEEYYLSFEGLYYITEEDKLFSIPLEDCKYYAPAVVKLYDLEIFNTKIL